MKNIFKSSGALLLCAALLAGCSGTTTTSSQKTSDSSTASVASSEKTSDKTSSAADSTNKSLLDQLVAASDSDEDAQKVWMEIFQNTVDAYDGKLETEGDGELYAYQTDGDTSFVDANILYKNGRKSGILTTPEEILSADLMDDDDSYNKMLYGTGLFSSIRKDGSTSAAVTLTSTSDDRLVGKIAGIVENSYSKDTFAAENLKDVVINCGYRRAVDPIANASLYDFDLTSQTDGYELKLKIKNLDDFLAQASTLTVSTDGPSLLLNEVTEENFVFKFDKNGVLKSVGNNIFRAIYTLQDKEYVNVRNITEIESLDDVDDFQQIVGSFMSEVEDKKLTEGSDFDIEDWE